MASSGNHFGGRLRELREAKGLSQQALARLSGLGQKSISNWESGIREPLWGNVLTLCKALEVEVTAFLYPPADPAKAKPGRPARAKPASPNPPKPRGRPRKGKGGEAS